jgi:uncharacterized protein YkwD
MFRICVVCGALLLGHAASSAASASLFAAGRLAAGRLVVAGQQAQAESVLHYDSSAELQLLQFANQSRAKAGAPPLKLDAGLTQAARVHAQAMVDARQLSHQFEGEPSLPQRLAAATKLNLERSGENVALDSGAGPAHQHLMLSPPHRENLLNPTYNVVGMGVIRSGEYLYIVQDFGQALASYSAAEVKDRIAAAVVQARREAKRTDLQQLDLAAANEAACSMAQADTLSTSAVHQLALRYTVIAYNSLRPETLPESALRALSGASLRNFSLAVCFARTPTYPTGAYWIVLLLN